MHNFADPHLGGAAAGIGPGGFPTALILLIFF
jgi:hypothetical protein